MNMKKTAIGFLFLATLLVTCAGIGAQTPSFKAPTPTPTPDLSKLNIAKILQQLQATPVPPSAEETSPFQVLAQFLQLTPSQVSELELLLQARQTNLMPLVQTVEPYSAAWQFAEFGRKSGSGGSRSHPNSCVGAASGPGPTGLSDGIHRHPHRGAIAKTPGCADRSTTTADPSGLSADLSVLIKKAVLIERALLVRTDGHGRVGGITALALPSGSVAFRVAHRAG